jgi:hypothetical protein
VFGEGNGESVGAGLLDIVGPPAVGFQLRPGLITIFSVSPSLMLYSFKSFPSCSAFPFKSSRCASAGGAEGKEDSWAFIVEIESVGCTLRVNVAAGFRDLKISEMEAAGRFDQRLGMRIIKNM